MNERAYVPRHPEPPVAEGSEIERAIKLLHENVERVTYVSEKLEAALVPVLREPGEPPRAAPAGFPPFESPVGRMVADASLRLGSALDGIDSVLRRLAV
jgi:hypothetical protein